MQFRVTNNVFPFPEKPSTDVLFLYSIFERALTENLFSRRTSVFARYPKVSVYISKITYTANDTAHFEYYVRKQKLGLPISCARATLARPNGFVYVFCAHELWTGVHSSKKKSSWLTPHSHGDLATKVFAYTKKYRPKDREHKKKT